MEKEKIVEMVLDLLGEVDYDIAKQYDTETAEEPDQVEKSLNKLVKIVEKHLKKSAGKKK